jgi:hypothetical protein
MKILAVFTFILFVNTSSAQDTIKEWYYPHPNSIQLDIGSYGLFYSMHYERIILNMKNLTTSGRLGISIMNSVIGTNLFYLPIEVNELYSFKNHHIEIGLGFIIENEVSLNGNMEWTLIDRLTGRIGYRYQRFGGKVIFRIGYTPFLFSYANSGENFLTAPKEYFNSFGASIGYSF